MRLSFSILTVLLLLIGSGHLWGQFSNEIEQISIVPEGAFSINDGALHYWTNGEGYRIYALDWDVEQVIGLPTGSAPAGGYDLPFGVFDAEAGLFYGGTYVSEGLRYVSVYDEVGSTWLFDASTLAGFTDVYGATLYAGALTVAGRTQAWNSEGTLGDYIFNFDTNPSSDGTVRHDALILTEDSSGAVAYGPDGGLYYATTETNSIYYWSAAQIASVTDDFDVVSTDSYLALSTGQKLLDLPGHIGGIAVDEAGVLFFTMNIVGDYPEQFVAKYDSDAPDGYEVLVSSAGSIDYYGHLAIEGIFSEGGALYFSPGVEQDLARIGVPSYSASLDDNENRYDAPIPGFVGPAGEGKVAVEGYEDALSSENYVNPLFTAWANEFVDYSPALVHYSDGITYNVDSYWQYPQGTLGPVTGDHYDIAALGDQDAEALADGEAPGALTIRFEEPILNLSGADFAIFENAFVSLSSTSAGSVAGQVFAELAYAEVSSDGVHFVRFPSVSNTPNLVGAYGSIQAEHVFNLVGKHCNAYGESWGTPFDLSYLEGETLVLDGTVDLNAITHIRVVDIPGNGSFLDSLGQPIYDAWVTWGSGGADIEAFGAISQSLTYEKWEKARGLLPADDEDGDGWTNLEEYAFMLDPELADGASAISFVHRGSDLFEFTFPRDERISDLRYILEGCRDLSVNPAAEWEVLVVVDPMTAPVAAEETQVAEVNEVLVESVAAQASVGVLQNIRVRIDSNNAGQAFFRVRIESVE
ncbi:hypothetical protein ACWPKS_02570 [Coraliomargarita sp. W4R72]